MKNHSIILYEDPGWKNLLPLVYARAVFQLVCGMGDLLSKVQYLAAEVQRDKQSEFIPINKTDGVQGWCRRELAEVVAEQTGLSVNRSFTGRTLLLNGRGIWHRLPAVREEDSSWVGVVGESNETACIFANNDLTAKLSPSVLLDEAGTQSLLAELPQRDVSKDVSLIAWPWELVLSNERMIVADWERSHCNEIQGIVTVGTYLLGRDSIHIGPQSKIKPCVVIDADNGPVCIGKNVTILPHSYVQGPAYIADDCLLQPGTTIHSGTTIGPCSKVGGEIEASIIHGYSNKQHDGFLGHSYIGSWVNIAADCLNSDLKNTYGTIRVPINGREVDSGEQFVGMIIGDHSKLGINVSFPTGAIVGFCSSVFTLRSPKFVPSFAWLDGNVVERYDEQHGLTVARKVMARRNMSMSPAEERLFRTIRKVAWTIEHHPKLVLEEAE